VKKNNQPAHGARTENRFLSGWIKRWS